MFQKWANWLHDNVVHAGNVEHDVWIFPATFCPRLDTNDGQHLSGDEAIELDNMRRARNNNVEFNQTKSPYGALDFQSPHILGMLAHHNINMGEELYCNYSSSFDYNSYVNWKSALRTMVVYAIGIVVWRCMWYVRCRQLEHTHWISLRWWCVGVKIRHCYVYSIIRIILMKYVRGAKYVISIVCIIRDRRKWQGS